MTAMRLLSFALFLVASCSPPAEVTRPTSAEPVDEWACGSCGPDLTEEEVATLSARANAGELDAAATLSVWFANEGDEAKSHEWLEFDSAQRGDCNSAQVLYGDYALREPPNRAEMARVRDMAADVGCVIREH